MTYSIDEIVTMIKDFKNNINVYQYLIEEEESLTNNITRKYESIGGGSSNTVADPTFAFVNKRIKSDKVSERIYQKIKFIEDKSQFIKKDHHWITLDKRLKGYTCQEIGDLIGVGRTRVHNIIKEIATIMYNHQ